MAKKIYVHVRSRDSSLRSHPNFSESDYKALKSKGYSDREIKAIWDRDRKEGKGALQRKPAPDLVKHVFGKDASAIYSKGKFSLVREGNDYVVMVAGKKYDRFGNESRGKNRVDELAQQEAEHQSWLKSPGAKDATDVAGVPPDVQRQMIAYLDDHWNESIEKFIAWSKSKGWTEQQARRVWKLVHH